LGPGTRTGKAQIHVREGAPQVEVRDLAIYEALAQEAGR